MHIMPIVNIPFMHLSESVLMNFPRVITLAFNALGCQKCKGRLCNLTQIGIFDTTIVLESNSRNHGVMNSLRLPQNHGLWLRIMFLSSYVLNLTMKNPLGHN